MSILFLFIKLAAIFLVGVFITRKVIPFVFVRVGRLLGFPMKLTPITERRIARFKRLKRGYYAFVLISTLFVISLFLELLVNDKALVIYYNGRIAFPAVSELLDTWIPFVRISSYNKKSDFGLVGDEPVHYRTFARYCGNPELLKALIFERKKELKTQQEYITSLGDPPLKPESMGKPEPFGLKVPEELGKDATGEEKERFKKALEAWNRKRAAYAIRFIPYETYLDALWEWEDYEREKKILEEIRNEIPLLETSYENFKADKAWALMPFYPYGPSDHLLDLPGNPPYSPSWWPYLTSTLTGQELPEDPKVRAEMKLIPVWSLPFGSTDNSLDVFPQLAYGFRVSFMFALIVAALGYTIGVIVGALMGYFGGWTDILVQRFIEIYGSIPFLYTIMIIASIVQPGFVLLVVIMVILRSWLGITYYVRGEFYREKAKDYVTSAIGTGVSDWKVITRHIIPNSLVPVVTFAPFGIVAYIISLVSLDYLGFGLPPGSPSWGYLLSQGSEYIESYPHLILITSLALAATLFCVVVIGEAVREAFDPKVFSRLR